MNVEVTVDDPIKSMALSIAAVVYGGIVEGSPQWQKCMDAARAIAGTGPQQPPRNRWIEARAAFEACQRFNQQCPTGTEGIITPQYGPQMTTMVEQVALVFPHPRDGQHVMAWFRHIGWAEVERFQPSPKKMMLCDELAAAALSAKQQGRLDMAKAILSKAIEHDPTYWTALNEMGVILVSEHRYAEALEWYAKAKVYAPDSPEVINNRGTANRLLGNADEAVIDLTRAAAMLPKNDQVTLNLASTIEDTGDFEGSLKVLNDRIAKFPNELGAPYNKALLLMSFGRFAEGWPMYDYRLLQPMVNAHYEHYGIPRLAPCNYTGKTVLVWAETGIGDELLAASILPDLIAQTKKVTFLCTDRLVPLIRRSFPEIIVGERPTAQLVDLFKRQPLRPELVPQAVRGRLFDCQMSMADLGMSFRPTYESFPKRAGFLKCDKARRDLYWNALAEDGKLLVGISWHSVKNPKIGDLKTVKLEKWRDILTTPGVKFVNLQYGDTSDIEDAEKLFGVKIHRIPDLNFERDLDGFASLVAAMDLVVSTSNTTIHVAGGLNVPAWVMTPHGAGKLWYFFRECEKLPWYDSVTLYRQHAASQWDGVIARIAADLRKWVEQERA